MNNVDDDVLRIRFNHLLEEEMSSKRCSNEFFSSIESINSIISLYLRLIHKLFIFNCII